MSYVVPISLSGSDSPGRLLGMIGFLHVTILSIPIQFALQVNASKNNAKTVTGEMVSVLLFRKRPSIYILKNIRIFNGKYYVTVYHRALCKMVGITRNRKTGDTDKILSVLSNHCRRDVARYLVESDQDTSIDEIVDHLDDGSADIGAVKVQLHHVHLPKMQDCGLLEYDPRSGDIVIHADVEVDSLLFELRDQ